MSDPSPTVVRWFRGRLLVVSVGVGVVVAVGFEFVGSVVPPKP